MFFFQPPPSHQYHPYQVSPSVDLLISAPSPSQKWRDHLHLLGEPVHQSCPLTNLNWTFPGIHITSMTPGIIYPFISNIYVFLAFWIMSTRSSRNPEAQGATSLFEDRWMASAPLNMSPLFAAGHVIATTTVDRFLMEPGWRTFHSFLGRRENGWRGKGVFSFVPTRIVLPSKKEEDLDCFMFFFWFQNVNTVSSHVFSQFQGNIYIYVYSTDCIFSNHGGLVNPLNCFIWRSKSWQKGVPGSIWMKGSEPLCGSLT